MYINYVREINGFNRYANDNLVSGSERLLWFGLMDCINSYYAKGSDWPDGFITIPNKRLLSHVPFGEDALLDARNRLKQRGLIECKPGQRNKTAPQYRVRYFSCMEFSTGFPQSAENNPEKTGNAPDNMPGNIRGNTPDNMQGNIRGNAPDNWRGNMPDINPNVNVYHNADVNEDRNFLYDDEDEDAEEIMRARAHMREAAAAAIKRHFGRDATPSEAEQIARMAQVLDIPQPLLDRAARTAAQFGARSPARYISELLREYDAQDIRTPEELDEYSALRDLPELPDNYGRSKYEQLEDLHMRRMIAHGKEIPEWLKRCHERKGGGENGVDSPEDL